MVLALTPVYITPTPNHYFETYRAFPSLLLLGISIQFDGKVMLTKDNQYYL
jgi:hypothetical protein